MELPRSKSDLTLTRVFIEEDVLWNSGDHQGETEETVFLLDHLPNEMLGSIFVFLPLADLIRLESVSKRWKHIAEPIRLRMTPRWRWGSGLDRKSPAIALDPLHITCSRPSKEGHNPAVMSLESLTRERAHFRVEIKKVGNWLGIGVADPDFQIEGGNTLGTQKKGVNSSYFWQNSGIRKIQMFAEDKQEAHPLCNNDVIDIKVDFDNHRIQYWLNGALQGAVSCRRHRLVEGKLHACVNLSVGSEIAFRNNDKDLYVDTFPRMIEDVVETPPEHPFPTQWRWGTTPTRRAAAIDVDDKRLLANRRTGGHNPSIMCTLPFSKKHYYFRVQILRLGSWIGVGLADKAFSLNSSTTLGTQPRGVNSCYFFQTSGINRLQMYGEAKMDAAKINPLDVIAIRVDFDLQRIYYYLNDVLQGYISCSKSRLLEGKIFPCINMSTGSTVQIQNVQVDPFAKTLSASPFSSIISQLKKKLF